MDNATPPAPVKLKTSISVFSCPSGTVSMLGDFQIKAVVRFIKQEIWFWILKIPKTNFNFPGPLITVSVALYWSPKACLPIQIGFVQPVNNPNQYTFLTRDEINVNINYLGQGEERFCKELVLWRQYLQKIPIDEPDSKNMSLGKLFWDKIFFSVKQLQTIFKIYTKCSGLWQEHQKYTSNFSLLLIKYKYTSHNINYRWWML